MRLSKKDPEAFASEWKSFFLQIRDDAFGSEFKRTLARQIDDQGLSLVPSFSQDDWAELAFRLNDGPVFHSLAAKMSPQKRNAYFPEIAHKFEEKLDEVGAPAMSYGAGHQSAPAASSGTTTASVAYYPVPLGGEAPGAKKKKKRKKKR